LKLFEYEAKDVLTKYGIPVPKGVLVSDTDETRRLILNLQTPLVVKAQVLVAGRGKVGGILFVDSVEEAERAVEKLLSMEIKGMPVKSVRIEEKVQVKKELYFGLTIDRLERRYLAIASGTGGVDIEEVASKTPEKVILAPIDPELGFQAFQAREIAKRIGYSGSKLTEVGSIFERLYSAGMSSDAELIEMNPLVEDSAGNLVAADARLIIDDNALFRHQEYRSRLLEGNSELSPQELEALKNGLAYVMLDGQIGIIGNGAGLVMATLDTIQYFGGKPANFLDVGGGAPAEQTAIALKIVLSNPEVKVLFINILGGITRCDEVAKGILEAKEKQRITIPMIIRLVGTNEEEGKRILRDAGVEVLESMEEAAERAVEISKEQ
jgi:succinyl-CoA synthetase beta subunit